MLGANRKPFVDASPMLIRNNLLSPLSCPVGTPAGTAASPWASAEGNLSRWLGTAGNFKEVKCRHNVNTKSFISLGMYEGNLVGCIREFSWQESLINTHLNPTNASVPTVWGDISWGGWGPLSFPVIFSVFCLHAMLPGSWKSADCSMARVPVSLCRVLLPEPRPCPTLTHPSEHCLCPKHTYIFLLGPARKLRS